MPNDFIEFKNDKYEIDLKKKINELPGKFIVNITSVYSGAPPASFSYNVYLNNSFQLADVDRQFSITFDGGLGIYSIEIRHAEDTTYDITAFQGGYGGEIQVFDTPPTQQEQDESLTSTLFTLLGILVILIVVGYGFKRFVWDPAVKPKLNLEGGVIQSKPKTFMKSKKSQ